MTVDTWPVWVISPGQPSVREGIWGNILWLVVMYIHVTHTLNTKVLRFSLLREFSHSQQATWLHVEDVPQSHTVMFVPLHLLSLKCLSLPGHSYQGCLLLEVPRAGCPVLPFVPAARVSALC